MDDPVVIRAGGTIEDVAHAVHRSLVVSSLVSYSHDRLLNVLAQSHFASALVWGQSSKPANYST